MAFAMKMSSLYDKGWSNSLSNSKVIGGVKNTFKGNLKGQEIELTNVNTKNINYTKRNPAEAKILRNEFNSSVRKGYLKDFSEKYGDYLNNMGFSDTDILKLQDGKVPTGYQVHHKLPLDDGGTNSYDNLVLIKNDPYHKVITNY